MDVSIGGTRVRLIDSSSLLADVDACLRSHNGPPTVLASANLDHVYHFGAHSDRADPATQADARWIVTADGMPIVWGARRLTHERWEQLAGSDLLPELFDLAERAGARVGVVGGWPSQHAALAETMGRRWPSLDLAGCWAPARGDLGRRACMDRLAQEIAAADIQLLVVALGKPRQEQWLRHHLVATGARVALAFGAAPDFLAGTSNRAPKLLRRLGLEWLYRLLQEPGRLWRRYLLQGPVALWRVFRWSRHETQ